MDKRLSDILRVAGILLIVDPLNKSVITDGNFGKDSYDELATKLVDHDILTDDRDLCEHYYDLIAAYGGPPSTDEAHSSDYEEAAAQVSWYLAQEG